MNINFVAPINDLSYGLVGLNLLVEASKHHKISLWPIGNINAPPIHHSTIKNSIDNSKLYDIHAPCVRLWHQFDMAQMVGKGKRVGYTIFELNMFTDVEKHQLSALDQLFVCSEWAKNVVENNCIKIPCCVVPLGVDLNIFSSGKLNSCVDTVFLNVGKLEIRKGHDILIESFCKAFSNKDNVKLILICCNPFLSAQQNTEWVNFYKNSSLGEKVSIIDKRFSTQSELVNVMRQADCGVFPTRAEGWCLLKNTKIYTNNGIKEIKDICVGDLVINHKGEYNKVTALLDRDYSGKMLAIKCLGSNVVNITPEHLVYAYQQDCSFSYFKNKIKDGIITPKWILASDVKKGDFLLLPKPKENYNLINRQNVTIKLTKDLMRLFGYYVAEGSGNKGSIAFSFHTKEIEYHEDVKQLMFDNFGLECNIEYFRDSNGRVIKHACNLWFISKVVKELLQELFGNGAKQKKIPSEFYSCNNELIMEFLTGLFRGDGSVNNNGIRLSTTSENLALAVRLLFIKLGMRSSFKYFDKITSKGPCREFTISVFGEDALKMNFRNSFEKREKKYKFIINEDYLIMPVVSVTTMQVNDKVYNLSVEKENTYCTTGFIVHNCLPILETLALGKHVIATDYSGHTEFLNNENSLLIPCSTLESAYDGKWFFNQGEWMSLGSNEIDCLVEHMRTIHKWKQEGTLGINDAGIATARKFSWQNSATKLVNAL